MLTLICPKCGLEKNKNTFIDNICKDCYYHENAKFEVNMKDVFICKSCARMKFSFVWKPFSEDSFQSLIEPAIKSNLDFKLKNMDVLFLKKKIIIDLDLQVAKELFHHRYTIVPKFQYCMDCYKKVSDYFESLVQLRDFGNEKHIPKEFLKYLDKAKKEELKKGNYGAYLQKQEVVNNGIDYYLGSKNLALAFIKEIKEHYPVEKKDSYKLVGLLPGGKEKIRTTHLVRKKIPKRELEILQK